MQKLRHHVMEAEAVEEKAEALRMETEAIQKLSLPHSCCKFKFLNG